MVDQPSTDRHGLPDGDLTANATPPRAPRSTHGRLVVSLALLALLAIPAVTWLVRSSPTADGPLVAASATSVGDPSSPGTEEPTPSEGAGDEAPDFTVELFDGRSFTLSRHLAEDGRPVVLNFWASWCFPCLEEMPAFDAVAQRRTDVLILGVAVLDGEEAVRAFAEEIAVTYPLAHDSEGLIIERYPTLGLPTTWFITADRTVAEVRIGQLDQEHLEDLIDRHLTS